MLFAVRRRITTARDSGSLGQGETRCCEAVACRQHQRISRLHIDHSSISLQGCQVLFGNIFLLEHGQRMCVAVSGSSKTLLASAGVPTALSVATGLVKASRVSRVPWSLLCPATSCPVWVPFSSTLVLISLTFAARLSWSPRRSAIFCFHRARASIAATITEAVGTVIARIICQVTVSSLSVGGFGCLF